MKSDSQKDSEKTCVIPAKCQKWMELVMNIYETCPVLENERFIIRLIEAGDAEDLTHVYCDKSSLPFFNSDNCHGSNFYCRNLEDVQNTIKYWLLEYHEYKGFVRFSIVDRQKEAVTGTIEIFNRKAEDFYNNCGLLRLDVRSDCEQSEYLEAVFSLVTAPFYEWFDCPIIATKAPVYAVERIEALKKAGFSLSEEPLIGEHRLYYDYWIKYAGQ